MPIKNGYAYKFTGIGHWSTSPDDDWDTVMQSGGRGKYLGTRKIDGVQCTVWQKTPRQIFAQSIAMNPAPMTVRKRIERTYDQHAATELQLYMENDSGLYRQRQSIEKNLEKKILKGKFDLKLSEKLWMYWVDEGAKKYAKEFGDAREWHKMFDVPTRRHVAAQLAKEFVTEWNAQNRK